MVGLRTCPQSWGREDIWVRSAGVLEFNRHDPDLVPLLCLLCLECSSPRNAHDSLPHLLHVVIRFHHLSEDFPNSALYKNIYQPISHCCSPLCSRVYFLHGPYHWITFYASDKVTATSFFVFPLPPLRIQFLQGQASWSVLSTAVFRYLEQCLACSPHYSFVD